MSNVTKLTPELLKQLVLEERQKMQEAGLPGAEKAEEVDAADQASTLSHKIDHAKKLGIHESNLKKQLERIVRIREALKSDILKDL